MSGLKEFQNSITWLGGIWSSNDVYFIQQRDMYTANYRPDYPECSIYDQVIHQYFDFTNTAQLRGRFAFIRFYHDEGKCRSIYVKTLEELLQVVRGEVS